MEKIVELKKKRHKDFRGGKGYVTERNCTVNLFGRCWQFSMLTLEPKATISMHENRRNNEFYSTFSRFIEFGVSKEWNYLTAYNAGTKKSRLIVIKH